MRSYIIAAILGAILIAIPARAADVATPLPPAPSVLGLWAVDDFSLRVGVGDAANIDIDITSESPSGAFKGTFTEYNFITGEIANGSIVGTVARKEFTGGPFPNPCSAGTGTLCYRLTATLRGGKCVVHLSQGVLLWSDDSGYDNDIEGSYSTCRDHGTFSGIQNNP